MLKNPAAKEGIAHKCVREPSQAQRKRTRLLSGPVLSGIGERLRPFGWIILWMGAAAISKGASNELRITSIFPQNGKVVVRWQGGTGPYQLLCKTNMQEGWRKVGTPTTGFSATNAVPNGPACLFQITTDVTAPTVPAGLQVTTNSCNQLSLKWNLSSDINGAGVKGYNIFRNSVLLKQVPATTNALLDENLAALTTFSYRVSAVDFVGNESAPTAAVTATTPSCANASPTANAGPDVTNKVGVPVTLTGANSRDPDGIIVSYAWNFGDGTSSAGTNAAHVYTNAGTFNATLTVTDNKGASSADTAVVKVLANQMPSANAGQDKAGLVGATLSFQGSGTDADGTISSYAWAFGDGAVASTANAAHAYTNAGTFTATLTVTDNSGGKATDTLSVVITNIPNRLPIADAGPDQAGLTGAAISFSGAGSSDPDGTIVSYQWNFGDGGAASGTNVSHAYTSAGSFTVTLSVTDNLGGKSVDTAVVNVAIPAGAGQLLAVANYGSSEIDLGQALAKDRFGNVFIGGGYYSHPFLVKQGPSGSNLWSVMIDGPGTGSIRALATDADGNVYITGNMFGSLYFASTPISSAGGSDIFIAKYSANGTHLWSKRYGSSKANAAVDEAGCSIAVDTNNNAIVVTGNFDETVDFGGGILISTAGQDLFLVKLSLTGNHIWSKRVGGSAGTIGTAVALDSNYNIFVAGQFSSPADFGSGLVTNHGSVDVFLAKYGPTGGNLWVKHFGTNSPWPSTATASGLAVDSQDNVIVTGNYQLEMSFGGANLAYSGYGDAFVAKYSGRDGTHLWSKSFGGVGVDQGNAVAVGRNDDIFITGKLGSAINFGGGPLPFTSGQVNIFVAGLRSDGAYRWAKSYGVGLGESKSIVTDSLGNVNVAGNYSSASFNGGTLPNSGLRDIFVLKFGP